MLKSRKIRSIYGNANFQAPAVVPAPPVAPAAAFADAYYGIFGDMLRAVEGEIESTPASVLVGWLALLGNVIGRGAYAVVRGRWHYPALFVCNVGGTGDGKEDSWDVVRYPFRKVDPDWFRDRVRGIGSGEGLIEAVADDPEGKPVDKRFVCRLPELSRALKAGRRENSITSETLREAWDGDLLSVTNRKSNSLQADDYTISVVGDITPSVLRKMLAAGPEGEDGWSNRFLYVAVRHVRNLPNGGNITVLDHFLPALREIVAFGTGIGHMARDAEADALWAEHYDDLRSSGDRVPHTDRARPQVLRLSMLYAIADQSRVIKACHLKAALAVWEYCVGSARELFGESGAAEAGALEVQLLGLINAAKATGISRAEIRDKIGHRVKAEDVDRALAGLEGRRLAVKAFRPASGSGGRKAEVWYSADCVTTPPSLSFAVGIGTGESEGTAGREGTNSAETGAVSSLPEVSSPSGPLTWAGGREGSNPTEGGAAMTGRAGTNSAGAPAEVSSRPEVSAPATAKEVSSLPPE